MGFVLLWLAAVYLRSFHKEEVEKTVCIGGKIMQKS